MVEDGMWGPTVAHRYDTTHAAVFSDAVLGPTTDRLAELAGGGPALEFAIGTGRVAMPLTAKGVPVSGIELSTAMVEQLRRKADETTIPVTVGDMATTRAPGAFTLVYLVYNTISNLLTQEAQLDCFANAARHLSPGGCFVIELWVPQLRTLPPGQEAAVFALEPGYAGIDTYDPVNQIVISHHFRFPPEGFGPSTDVTLHRSPHRYIWPAELDLMARMTGFTLESRHGDWSGGEFTAESTSHVSVYRLDS